MVLTTREILCIVRKDAKLRKIFKGVYAIDQLPRIILDKRPCALIVNLDPSWKPGSHWVAIFLEDKGGPAHYFDSFGRPPFDDAIISFLNRHSKQGWIYNGTRYQSISSTLCGIYCIAFLKSLARL